MDRLWLMIFLGACLMFFWGWTKFNDEVISAVQDRTPVLDAQRRDDYIQGVPLATTLPTVAYQSMFEDRPL